MENIRQKQVGEIIRREMSSVLGHQGKYIYGNALVTITHVKMTPDLSMARIYISIYNTDSKEAVLDALDENLSRLRFDIGSRVKKQLRIVPSLQFFIDDSLDEVEKLDRLFKSIEQSSTSANDPDAEV